MVFDAGTASAWCLGHNDICRGSVSFYPPVHVLLRWPPHLTRCRTREWVAAAKGSCPACAPSIPKWPVTMSKGPKPCLPRRLHWAGGLIDAPNGCENPPPCDITEPLARSAIYTLAATTVTDGAVPWPPHPPMTGPYPDLAEVWHKRPARHMASHTPLEASPTLPAVTHQTGAR